MLPINLTCTAIAKVLTQSRIQRMKKLIHRKIQRKIQERHDSENAPEKCHFNSLPALPPALNNLHSIQIHTSILSK